MNPQHLMSLNPRIAPRASARTARRIAGVLGSGVLVLGATACGSSDDPTNANAPTGTGNGGPQTSQQGGGQFPGADGLVAAVTGSTAQVQSQSNGQVAVTWNGTTTFTKQVAGSLADVTVGSCVLVTPVEDASSSGSSGSSSDATAPATEVDAGTVRITAKSSDGTCAGGIGGGAGPQLSGNGPGGAGGQPPAGAPTGAPGGSGSGRPQVRGFGGTVGEVTAVGATGFTVKSIAPPSTTTSTVAVTVSATTTYTRTAKAAAADVEVGVCVRAQGTTDETGAVTARTVAVSPATDGECDGGFRRSTTGGGPGTTGGSGTSGQES